MSDQPLNTGGPATQRLERASHADACGSREPIAIVGIGCHFPGATGADAFWRLLREGVDAIGEIPTSRWDHRAFYDPDPTAPGKANTRWGGFLERIEEFDAAFFGISPQEAAAMDPQQRILLEVACEALQDTGQPFEGLAGTQAGVFIGISSDDYSRVQQAAEGLEGPYAATANSLHIAANRLSYFLDLRGPSLTTDTDGSSSLVAVHLACESLRKGESELAIAGGVNVILSPAGTVSLTKAGLMAPDGRCKTFDAGANGYVRSEGAGVVVLKRLSRAEADGDRVYALIRGSAVGQGGRTNGLMAPSRQSQEALLRAAYRDACVAPERVRYVEAHGAGTFLGDVVEARALGAVLSEGRAAESPCLVGSVKTNVGHLEAAAGVAGLVKAALVLRHGEIPPSLHFVTPNPQIPFGRLKLGVAQALAPWPRAEEPRYAGVSSFGLGGTNAHVVLEEAPVAAAPADAHEKGADEAAYLLPLSAHSEAAMVACAERYRRFLADENSAGSLEDICYTASMRRSHFKHRLALVGRSHREMGERLAYFVDGSLEGRDASALRLPQRGGDERAALLESLAWRYTSGQTIEWGRLFPDGARQVELPAYAWQRERFWLERRGAADDGADRPQTSADGAEARKPLPGLRIASPLKEIQFETELSAEALPFLKDHHPFGTPVVPAAFHLLMALSAAEEVSGPGPYALTNITLSRAMVLDESARQKAQLILTADAGEVSFHLYSENPRTGWTLNGAGRLHHIAPEAAARAHAALPLEEIRVRCSNELDAPEFYRIFSEQGLDFGPAFQWVEHVWTAEGAGLGRLRRPHSHEAADFYKIYPGMLDSCYQVLAACHPSMWGEGYADGEKLFVLVSIAELSFYGYVEEQLWCHGTLRAPESDEEYSGDVRLLTAAGRCVAEMKGVKFRLVERERLIRAEPAAAAAAWKERLRRKQRAGRRRADVMPGEILVAAPSQRQPLVERYVRQQVARVTKFPASRLDPHEPLVHMGFDSLMSMEMLTRLQTDLGLTIPASKLIEGVSIAQLTDEVTRLIAEKSLLELIREPDDQTQGTDSYEVL